MKNNISNLIDIMKMTIFIFIISIFFFSFEVEASEDEVYLSPISPTERETHILYYGENYLELIVIFGQNCTNWSIDLKCPLFISEISGIDPDRVEKGFMYDPQLVVNLSAPVGDYQFPIYFNYTNDDNINVTQKFIYEIAYLPSIEIRKISLPLNQRHTFQIDIEIFNNISEINVTLDADGDIKLDPIYFNLYNVTSGNYSFSSKVYREKSFLGNSQEVGYRITGYINNRTIVFDQSNIDVTVSWSENVRSSLSDISYLQIILITSSIFVLFNVINYFYRRKREEDK